MRVYACEFDLHDTTVPRTTDVCATRSETRMRDQREKFTQQLAIPPAFTHKYARESQRDRERERVLNSSHRRITHDRTRAIVAYVWIGIYAYTTRAASVVRRAVVYVHDHCCIGVYAFEYFSYFSHV